MRKELGRGVETGVGWGPGRGTGRGPGRVGDTPDDRKEGDLRRTKEGPRRRTRREGTEDREGRTEVRHR